MRTLPQNILHHLTGYVDDDLIALAGQMEKPQSDREIDIGYRLDLCPFLMEKGHKKKPK